MTPPRYSNLGRDELIRRLVQYDTRERNLRALQVELASSKDPRDQNNAVRLAASLEGAP